uniref:Uncharacterized protein n=1 Tax=Plectus sambesii TaxID=2011161 RepID=A0A914VA48_9BILA
MSPPGALLTPSVGGAHLNERRRRDEANGADGRARTNGASRISGRRTRCPPLFMRLLSVAVLRSYSTPSIDCRPAVAPSSSSSSTLPALPYPKHTSA